MRGTYWYLCRNLYRKLCRMSGIVSTDKALDKPRDLAEKPRY
jgi:hypothetical protein